MPSSLPSWHRESFGRRHNNLVARSRIKSAIRRWFEADNFVEVDTPVLQRSPGNETHITAFATTLFQPGEPSLPLFLHTSPEFACKKLLAAGMDRLFTIAPVFRNRERGRLHHPEFTMVEWYRRTSSIGTLIDDAAALLRTAADAAEVSALRHRGFAADPHARPTMLSVVEAFHAYAQADLDTMLPDTSEAHGAMAAVARRHGLRIATDDSWSDLFSKIISAVIEPRLGHGQATILHRYPASEAALARLCPDDTRFAERFELYVCGIEVANAFAELTDAAEQNRRFQVAESERARIYGERYPIDADFLAAVDALPACCGIALGFDRLVMLATDAAHIDDVLWLPVAAGDAEP